jgi:hypothetical protein
MIDADRERLKAFENRVIDLEREAVRLQDQINFLASKDENDDEDDDPDPELVAELEKLLQGPDEGTAA